MKRFFKQFGLLLVLVGIALILIGIVTMALMFVDNTPVRSMHIALWLQNLVLMIGVPLAWAAFQNKKENKGAGLSWQGVFASLRFKTVDWRFMALTICLMIVSLPASELLDWASLKFPWPESIRTSCEASFVKAQQIYLMMVNSADGILGYLELFLLMCLSAAVGEEMMFRGALTNCFVKGGGFKWIPSILMVSLIFALIHGDMMGLTSRFVMGVLLAFLVYWSGSLWPSVLAHCMNNVMAFITFKMCTEEELLTMDRELSFSPIIIACSVVATILLLWQMWKMRVKIENL